MASVEFPSDIIPVPPGINIRALAIKRGNTYFKLYPDNSVIHGKELDLLIDTFTEKVLPTADFKVTQLTDVIPKYRENLAKEVADSLNNPLRVLVNHVLKLEPTDERIRKVLLIRPQY